VVMNFEIANSVIQVRWLRKLKVWPRVYGDNQF